jgi:hypothetical protein
VEIYLLMVFHCAEHVLLADEIIFITEEENSLSRIICITQCHITFYVIVVRVGVEKFFEAVLLGQLH